MFYVYMLRCSDSSYYVGHTNDLDARLAAHQRGLVPGHTIRRRPVRLVWSEQFDTREDAFARERQVKGWSRAKKEALIAGDWDRVRTLARSRTQGGDSPGPARSPGDAGPAERDAI